MKPPAPPIKLTGQARKFWERHAGRLHGAGLLTDADVDTFAVLSVVIGKFHALAAVKPGADRFREMVQLQQLLKQIHQYGREFGLFPASRKRSRLNTEGKAPADEFGL